MIIFMQIQTFFLFSTHIIDSFYQIQILKIFINSKIGQIQKKNTHQNLNSNIRSLTSTFSPMQSQVSQTILYDINLPSFMHNYKSNLVKLIVPKLLELKQFINEENNQLYVNPFVVIFAITVTIYVLRSVWIGLFGKNDQSDQKTSKQSRQLNVQLNDLKKQLKALKTSFLQMNKEFQNQTFKTLRQQKIQSPQYLDGNQQGFTQQLFNSLLPLYTESLDQNKKLINYVLESQFQVIKELKRFKKIQKASVSSSGRPSTSTIKSKVSQKKLSSPPCKIQKSPMKTINPMIMVNPIPKPGFKSLQKHLDLPLDSEKRQTAKENKLESQLRPVQESMIIQQHKHYEEVQKTLRVQQKVAFKKEQNLTPTPEIVSIQPINNTKTEVYRVAQEQYTNKIEVFEQTRNNLIVQSTRKTEMMLDVQQFKLEVREESSSTPVYLPETEENLQKQQGQKFVPRKLPVLKSMNPPKTGPKRAPPPPPRK